MEIGERNWLLRELKARFVTPFPSLPRGLSVVSGSKPLLIKGGVGEDCRSLSAKGAAFRGEA